MSNSYLKVHEVILVDLCTQTRTQVDMPRSKECDIGGVLLSKLFFFTMKTEILKIYYLHN